MTMYRIQKWIQNFWYYHKVHLIIILVILMIGIYLILSQQGSIKSDYDIAIVSADESSGEHMPQIRDIFQQAGTDQNGDGVVVVNMHMYRFTVGAEGQDRTAVAGLDADLVGNMSGIFFVEDPDVFEKATNGLAKSSDALPVHTIPALSEIGIDNLSLLIRTNADEKYTQLLSALIN